MAGRLIVFEGMDCTGKTTIINKLIKDYPSKDYVYSKGIGSKNLIGRFARKFPSTVIFFVELVFRIFFTILPNLKKERIILQDRYDISITSYVPLVRKKYNKFFVWFFKRFIIRPDAIIYLTLPLQEHLRRLRLKGKKYELILSKNPWLIIQRKREYTKWFNNFKGPKILINTHEVELNQEVAMIGNFISHT